MLRRLRNLFKKVPPNVKIEGDVDLISTGRFLIKGVLKLGRSYRSDVKNTFIAVHKLSSIEVDEYFAIHEGSTFSIDSGSKLAVGNSYISRNSVVRINHDSSIGYGTIIAEEFIMMTDNSHAITIDGVERPTGSSIEIGNNVWIGSRVTVLPGTIIEDGVIIAAGSVVRGHCKSNCLYSGVPAKLVKEGVSWK